MSLTASAAAVTLVVVVVGVMAWAVVVSAASAARGPEWASRFLATSQTLLFVLLAVSVVALFAVEPAWVPLGAAYAFGVAAWIAGRVRHVVVRGLSAGPYEIDPARRYRIVQRAMVGLVGTALVVVGAGAAVWASSRTVAAAAAAAGSIFLVGAGALAWTARNGGETA